MRRSRHYVSNPLTYQTRDGRTLSTRDHDPAGATSAHGGFLGVYDLDSDPRAPVKRHDLDLGLRGAWRFSEAAVREYRAGLDDEGFLALQVAVERRLRVMGSSAGRGRPLWHRVERVLIEERLARERSEDLG